MNKPAEAGWRAAISERSDLFINYPSRKSSVPLRIIVPNLFTTVAMCCGLASIHYSLKGDWDRAMFAVILSAVFDALDGRAARLLKVTSPFGEVLDSLSDFLSFGVAPAMLLYLWMLKDQDVFGLMAVTAFVLCSAMRLARFTAAARPAPPNAMPFNDGGAQRTTEPKASSFTDLTTPSAAARPTLPIAVSFNDGDVQRTTLIKAKFFTGLATPSAAAAVMVPVMLSYSKIAGPWVRHWLGMPEAKAGEKLAEMDSTALPTNEWVTVGVIAYVLVIAFWQVSRVPMFSFKKMRVSRRAVVPILIAGGLVVVLGVRDFWLLMAGLALVYLGTLPISWMSQQRIMKRPVSELEARTRVGGGRGAATGDGQH